MLCNSRPPGRVSREVVSLCGLRVGLPTESLFVIPPTMECDARHGADPPTLRAWVWAGIMKRFATLVLSFALMVALGAPLSAQVCCARDGAQWQQRTGGGRGCLTPMACCSATTASPGAICPGSYAALPGVGRRSLEPGSIASGRIVSSGLTNSRLGISAGSQNEVSSEIFPGSSPPSFLCNFRL